MKYLLLTPLAFILGFVLTAYAYEFRRLEQHPDYYVQPDPEPTEESPCDCWCSPPLRLEDE